MKVRSHATTILVFNWEEPLDTDMQVGSSHMFAHPNSLEEITTYDRVLIAGMSQEPSMDGAIDPKRHFWLLNFKLEWAAPVELKIRLLCIYEKMLLRELDEAGAESLQQSAMSGGEIQTLSARVRLLAPQPMGQKRADEVRRKILGAGARERELGAAHRKANSGWRIGHNPGKKK